MAIHRPSLPYCSKDSLPNNNRFGLLDKRPPTAEMFDAEFNALTDDVNMLEKAINDVQVGKIIGADNILNKNKLITTDGHGNLSWTLVTSNKLEDSAVTTIKLKDTVITTPKIENAAITGEKIGLLAVTPQKISSDNATVGLPLVSQANSETKFAQVPAAGIENAAITGEKIGLLAVTPQKISSNNAVAGLPLVSQGGSSETTFAQVPAEGIKDAAITMNKLVPNVARGIVVAAGRFKMMVNNVDCSNCFGIKSIYGYVNTRFYWELVYSGNYTKTPIITATAEMMIGGSSHSIAVLYNSNGPTGVKLVSLDDADLPSQNYWIYFQVISMD